MSPILIDVADICNGEDHHIYVDKRSGTDYGERPNKKFTMSGMKLNTIIGIIIIGIIRPDNTGA